MFKKRCSESLLNLKIFYLNHAVYKILQFLMMEQVEKLDLIAIAKENLKKSVFVMDIKPAFRGLNALLLKLTPLNYSLFW